MPFGSQESEVCRETEIAVLREVYATQCTGLAGFDDSETKDSPPRGNRCSSYLSRVGLILDYLVHLAYVWDTVVSCRIASCIGAGWMKP